MKEIRKKIKTRIDLKSFFRVNKVADMFHLGNLNSPISIIHPGFSLRTNIEYKFDKEKDINFFKFDNFNSSSTTFDNDFTLINFQFYASPIKPY